MYIYACHSHGNLSNTKVLPLVSMCVCMYVCVCIQDAQAASADDVIMMVCMCMHVCMYVCVSVRNLLTTAAGTIHISADSMRVYTRCSGCRCC